MSTRKKFPRHVSPAFVEDPLRVLRVARFAARFAPLGFTVAPETLELMRGIVASGEMAALVLDGQKVLPARAASLGFRFRFGNLEAALRDLLDRPSAA